MNNYAPSADLNIPYDKTTRIARVFPRRTKATPTDELAFTGGPGLSPPEVDAVHISVAFEWDAKRAEELAKDWAPVAPVQIGGPGVGTVGKEFTPGMYLREGYTITSRGCPNDCWFCKVWKRDGATRELPITDGFNVLDDNLLACSEQHIRAVFAMLKRQPQRSEFTGGFEAARLKEWHADLLADLRPKQVFFAYDTEDDVEPLVAAGNMLRKEFPLSRRVLRCYVLIGYPEDTIEEAERRLQFVLGLGFMPLAMLYRDATGDYDRQWRRFQREWANPTIIGSKIGKAK